MKPKVEAALTALWAATKDMDKREVCDLWNILTALRGPDNDSDWLKASTTEFIRQRAGVTRWMQEAAGMFVADPRATLCPIERALAIFAGSDHFASHVASASRALGITLITED